MKSYALSPCGHIYRLGGTNVKCGKTPGEHGIDFSRPGCTAGHPFVLTQKS